jgi:hypothetical protein
MTSPGFVILIGEGLAVALISLPGVALIAASYRAAALLVSQG